VLGAVLAVAVAAVLAGARSLAAIGEWAADAPGPVLVALGVRRDPLTGAWRPPAEATVRRVLARIDADAPDQVIGQWLAAQHPPPAANPAPPTPPHRPRRAVAVDGKTLRGSGNHPSPPVHLLAAMDHATGAVLGQTDVDATTNEITRFQPLLDRLDLTDTVVTADALHTQREHADWLVTHKHAAYLLVVKANQPTLQQQLKTLPWREVPVADHTRDRGHGRAETRRLQVTTVAGLNLKRGSPVPATAPGDSQVRQPCRSLEPAPVREGEMVFSPRFLGCSRLHRRCTLSRWTAPPPMGHGQHLPDGAW
jgi:predicted transposase YbfD/YdcC